jgi:CRISPR system Cascade subunit CasE
MTDSFFTRLTLQRDTAAIAPLIETLAPADPGSAMAVAHRLMWTVMPQEVQRHHPRGERPFLWRAAEQNKYYMLGPQPTAESPFFKIETKPYQPAFSPGDRLAFDLRVNATANRKTGVGADGRAERQRVDVAIDRMHAEERVETVAGRGERRESAAQAAAAEWLRARGERDGYRLEAMRLVSYRPEALPRRTGNPMKIGVFNLHGLLVVEDPAAFLQRILAGFGRAKAFGCGLMLLRRAPTP